MFVSFLKHLLFSLLFLFFFHGLLLPSFLCDFPPFFPPNAPSPTPHSPQTPDPSLHPEVGPGGGRETEGRPQKEEGGGEPPPKV